MKVLRNIALTVAAMCIFCASPSFATETSVPATIKVAVVNFKTCVDQSKLGKEEQSNFEALRKQMENALEDREKVLNELANKFNDADYLDSLSPETETELKRKFRGLSQELNQIQTQYYQTLNQANMKIVQILHEAVAIASKTVANNKNIDLIINEESSFFYNEKYDISQDIIVEMNKNYDNKDQEENNS
jgi:outer membrane protein